MLYLKGCPRCRGDIYADSDEYGAYRQCLQCGFVSYPAKEPPFSLRVRHTGLDNGELRRPAVLDGVRGTVT